MVHVPLRVSGPQQVDLLGHLDHVECGHTQDLGFAAFEQRAAVRATTATSADNADR